MKLTKAEMMDLLSRMHIPKAVERYLQGEEKEQMLTILLLMEPESIDISNQRSSVLYYDVDGVLYKVHDFGDNDYEVTTPI